MSGSTKRLRIYRGEHGPVAYDTSGRTWLCRQDGVRMVPISLTGPWVFCDRFDEA